MIVSGDDPSQGRKAQSRASELTERAKPLTGARRRLNHLFDLDERVLIDLAVEQEARDGAFANSFR
jgi:hypothetical protein